MKAMSRSYDWAASAEVGRISTGDWPGHRTRRELSGSDPRALPSARGNALGWVAEGDRGLDGPSLRGSRTMTWFWPELDISSVRSMVGDRQPSGRSSAGCSRNELEA